MRNSKIGDTVEYNGVKLKVVEKTDGMSDSVCFFYGERHCDNMPCAAHERSDGKEVLYVRERNAKEKQYILDVAAATFVHNDLPYEQAIIYAEKLATHLFKRGYFDA